MANTGYKALKLDRFGGLNTLLDPTNLPPWYSPDCRDVEFVTGLARTRPGLTQVLETVGSLPKINGIKSYIPLLDEFPTFPPSLQRLLFFTSGGELYRNLTETNNLIRSGLPTGILWDAEQAFGRAYMAFHTGQIGILAPAQYDGTVTNNLDRVSQEGPAKTTTSVPVDSATAGTIVAGTHKLTLIFETRNGYRTRADKFGNFWVAAGAKKVNISGIVTGPPTVTRRILAFTAAGGGSYFFIPRSSMVINDNTTTSLTDLDFSDTELLAGENVDPLFERIEIPACLKVLPYAGRILYIGPKNLSNYAFSATPNTNQVLRNLGFDGGWSSGIPLWWTVIVAGQSEETTDVVYGSALKITGDGTATRGHLTSQSLGPGVDIIELGKTYKVRAWVKRSLNLAQGTLQVFFQGSILPGLSVTAAQATTTYQAFEAEIFSASDNSSAKTLTVKVTGTPTSGEFFLVDEMEIFDEFTPFEDSVMLVSKPDDPESVDGLTGFLQVTPDNGQPLRNAFVIRDFLYLVKTKSLYVTEDNGGEPSTWEIRELSQRVGTFSPRGVGVGDEWAVIASRDGLFYFSGGEPQKISQEIQPTWDSINWLYGHTIDVKVDVKRKRIYVAAPFGTATEPNRIFTLDYREGFGDPLLQNGFGRKWSPWFISANSMALIEQPDGTQQLFIGNNSSNGKLYKLDGTSDDGAAINNYWQSGYFQNGGRLDFGYLIANVAGAGTCNLNLFKGDQSWLKILRPWTLKSQAFRNFERQIQIVGSRMAVKFGTNAVGENFSLQGASVWVKPAPWSPVRGTNL